MLIDNRMQYWKDVIFPKMNYSYNTVLVKIPTGFFFFCFLYDQLILNCVRENKVQECALAGVAPRIEHGPENQRAAGSIPSQGICLDCGLGPQ